MKNSNTSFGYKLFPEKITDESIHLGINSQLVSIVLNRCDGDKEPIFITSQMSSSVEIDAQIKKLKNELDQVAKRAKKRIHTP